MLDVKATRINATMLMKMRGQGKEGGNLDPNPDEEGTIDSNLM
jgi:hypothetical protein